MATSLYINTNAAPQTALVSRQDYPSPVSMTSLVRGDEVVFDIYLVDGEGGYDATSGAAGFTFKLGVGPMGQTYYTQATTFSSITNGWSMTLDMSVAAISAALGNLASIDATFEFQVTTVATSKRRTYLQVPVTILNQVN